MSTLSNMNIFKTRESIAIKFYLNHYWGVGKAASGFRPDRIRTLMYMATDSSQRVIMGKILLALQRLHFLSDHRLRSKLPLSVRKNSHRLIMGEMLLALYRLKFNWIFLILAGKDDNHKSLDEFKFRPDPTTDCRVNCH